MGSRQLYNGLSLLAVAYADDIHLDLIALFQHLTGYLLAAVEVVLVLVDGDHGIACCGLYLLYCRGNYLAFLVLVLLDKFVPLEILDIVLDGLLSELCRNSAYLCGIDGYLHPVAHLDAGIVGLRLTDVYLIGGVVHEHYLHYLFEYAHLQLARCRIDIHSDMLALGIFLLYRLSYTVPYPLDKYVLVDLVLADQICQRIKKLFVHFL